MATLYRASTVDPVIVNGAYLDPGPTRAPVWPLAVLLAGYPFLFLAGLSFLAVPLLAVPMALELYRRRLVRVPAGFGFWLLLLIVVLLSGLMLGRHAPGTLPPDAGIGRYLAFGLKLAEYAGVAVILLYIGNLTERELPTAKVVRWLSAFFVATVIGGLLGLVLPPLDLKTIGYYLMPGGLLSNGFVRSLVTVNFAQYHSIIGGEVSPRPAAPFQYTNAWGNALSLLLPWFVIGGVLWARTLARRLLAVGVLVVALIPVVYSLNRGLWLALLVMTAYLMVRLILRGSLVPTAVLLSAVATLMVVLVTTPLSGLIQDRLDNPHSDDSRSNRAAIAVEVAATSPFIGYGGQLSQEGAARSITVGPTADCPSCGQRPIGAEGQLWTLLVGQGFVGAALYVAFFVAVLWRYRRDSTPVGIAGAMGVVTMFFYMPLYRSIGIQLAIVMVGVGLWWRSASAQRAAARPAAAPLAAAGERSRA